MRFYSVFVLINQIISYSTLYFTTWSCWQISQLINQRCRPINRSLKDFLDCTHANYRSTDRPPIRSFTEAPMKHRAGGTPKSFVWPIPSTRDSAASISESSMLMRHLRKSESGPLHQTDCDVEMSKKTAASEASMHHTADTTTLGVGSTKQQQATKQTENRTELSSPLSSVHRT